MAAGMTNRSPPIHLRLFIPLVAVGLAACAMEGTTDAPMSDAGEPPDAATPAPEPTPADLDAYLRGLPRWDEVSPPVVEIDQPVAAPLELPEELAPDGSSWRCTSTDYEIARNPREIVMASPDAAVVWPGALLRGGSHLALGSLELLALRRERRAPMGISLQGGGILGIRGGVSSIVEQPIGSTVREGINQLVANALDAEVAVGAGTSSFSSVETHSTEQALLALGFDARYLGASVEAEFSAARAVDEHTLTATFVQRLFTVAVDAPESPADLFAADVAPADLQAVGVSETNLPLYIDSVSYGRMLMVSITSTDSVERMEAALSFAYDGLVVEGSAYAELELQETLSSATIEVVALGGPNTGLEALIASGRLADYFDGTFEINQVEPISFTIRNLGDNLLASVGSTTEYELRSCDAVEADLPLPSHHWPADGDLRDVVGGLALFPLGAAPGFTEGRHDRGAVFNGSRTAAVLETNVSPVPRDAGFAISAWVLPNASGRYQTIAALMGSARTAGDFQVRLTPSNGVQFFRRAASGSATMNLVESGAGAVPAGVWTHVTAVFGVGADDEATMRVYVNGVSRGGRPRPTNYDNTGLLTLFQLGGSEWSFAPRWAYAGVIDELMTFDYALTSDEVFVHFDRFDQYVATAP
jgi:thiol-activated cytolysin